MFALHPYELCTSVHLLWFIVPKFRLVVGFYYPMHLNSGELTGAHST